MQWFDKINETVERASVVTKLTLSQSEIFGVLDLTSLNDTDTEENIGEFAAKAIMPWGHVASICVYPDFVRMLAKKFAKTEVKIATVVNFPSGDMALSSVLNEIQFAIKHGAQEIDAVFPYRHYIRGEKEKAKAFVFACKAACGKEVPLKVILETGELDDLSLIADASRDVFFAGADFIKTSTGKVQKGATLTAAAVMLFVIQELTPDWDKPIGLKVSGGIRETKQAAQYVALAQEVMGREWVNAQTFRIGASKLADEIVGL